LLQAPVKPWSARLPPVYQHFKMPNERDGFLYAAKLSEQAERCGGIGDQRGARINAGKRRSGGAVSGRARGPAPAQGSLDASNVNRSTAQLAARLRPRYLALILHMGSASCVGISTRDTAPGWRMDVL